MSINVTLGEVKTQEVKPFPKLMKLNTGDKIVLFTKPKVGVVLVGDHVDKPGYYCERWVMDSFQEYNKPLPITLQNA